MRVDHFKIASTSNPDNYNTKRSGKYDEIRFDFNKINPVPITGGRGWGNIKK